MINHQPSLSNHLSQSFGHGVPGPTTSRKVVLDGKTFAPYGMLPQRVEPEKVGVVLHPWDHHLDQPPMRRAKNVGYILDGGLIYVFFVFNLGLICF